LRLYVFESHFVHGLSVCIYVFSLDCKASIGFLWLYRDLMFAELFFPLRLGMKQESGGVCDDDELREGTGIGVFVLLLVS